MRVNGHVIRSVFIVDLRPLGTDTHLENVDAPCVFQDVAKREASIIRTISMYITIVVECYHFHRTRPMMEVQPYMQLLDP